MSDGGRGRVSIGAEVWKSSQKVNAQRSAVRSIAWLGCRLMVWDVDEAKKLLLHFVKRGWPAMLEVAKGLPKTKLLCREQRPKDDREWIELSIAAEVPKGCTRQREAPALPLRPIEHDGSVTNGRKQSLLDVIVPNGAIRVDKQNVATSHTPECPDEDVQTNTGDEVKGERDDRDKND